MQFDSTVSSNRRCSAGPCDLNRKPACFASSIIFSPNAAAQGFLRLGKYLKQKGDVIAGNRYWQAGLTIIDTLLEEPYLSTKDTHQGLLLHSIYHRPNGWDYIPAGSKIPTGESSMWGDYHIREAALYLQKILDNEAYYTFFNCVQ